MRLGSFDIRYRLRNSIKRQVLTNFVTEFTLVEKSSSGICSIDIQPWRVFVDKASNAWGVGIGIVIMSLEGLKLEHSLRLGFRASNNKAEYEVLIVGLKVARKLEAKEVEIYLDS